ncbi:hypothetical protein [Marinospirillum sp.]|uniref:hypothetical protein n=1 Tax=Marinospirillum sp. TaxID=2183934 RepID=UPI00384C8A7C
MMSKRKKIKYLHEGRYVAEVEVEVEESEASWSPTLGIEDACKLDAVRDALRNGDLVAAARYGKVYEMKAVAF